jgi:hypothetical protein
VHANKACYNIFGFNSSTIDEYQEKWGTWNLIRTKAKETLKTTVATSYTTFLYITEEMEAMV